MSAGSAKLQHAVKNLRIHWEIVKESWSDQVSHDFEKNHLAPLETRVSGAIRGMDQLAEVLKKVRQDCG